MPKWHLPEFSVRKYFILQILAVVVAAAFHPEMFSLAWLLFLASIAALIFKSLSEVVDIAAIEEAERSVPPRTWRFVAIDLGQGSQLGLLASEPQPELFLISERDSFSIKAWTQARSLAGVRFPGEPGDVYRLVEKIERYRNLGDWIAQNGFSQTHSIAHCKGCVNFCGLVLADSFSICEYYPYGSFSKCAGYVPALNISMQENQR